MQRALALCFAVSSTSGNGKGLLRTEEKHKVLQAFEKGDLVTSTHDTTSRAYPEASDSTVLTNSSCTAQNLQTFTALECAHLAANMGFDFSTSTVIQSVTAEQPLACYQYFNAGVVAHQKFFHYEPDANGASYNCNSERRCYCKTPTPDPTAAPSDPTYAPTSDPTIATPSPTDATDVLTPAPTVPPFVILNTGTCSDELIFTSEECDIIAESLDKDFTTAKDENCQTCSSGTNCQSCATSVPQGCWQYWGSGSDSEKVYYRQDGSGQCSDTRRCICKPSQAPTEDPTPSPPSPSNSSNDYDDDSGNR